MQTSQKSKANFFGFMSFLDRTNSSPPDNIGRDSTINGVGGVGGGRCRRSGHRSRNEYGRDGEADVGVGDGVIGLRRREHPCGNDKRERSGCFDGSRRWEWRVIGGGKGMQGSEDGSGSRTRRGEKAAAVDANCRGWDGNAANGEKIRSTAKEIERARATHNVDTLAAMAVETTEGRRKRRHHQSSSLTEEDEEEDESKRLSPSCGDKDDGDSGGGQGQNDRRN
jgi:hypothetical protein